MFFDVEFGLILLAYLQKDFTLQKNHINDIQEFIIFKYICKFYLNSFSYMNTPKHVKFQIIFQIIAVSFIFFIIPYTKFINILTMPTLHNHTYHNKIIWCRRFTFEEFSLCLSFIHCIIKNSTSSRPKSVAAHFTHSLPF